MSKPATDRRAQFRRLVAEASSCRHAPRYNKYHAERVGSHASRKEYYRAQQLLLLQQAGTISDLRQQVPFKLLPTQRDPQGNIIERCVRYIADFVYVDNATGRTIVEDTKGVRTREYIIKRKLMLYIHGITITEI